MTDNDRNGEAGSKTSYASEWEEKGQSQLYNYLTDNVTKYGEKGMTVTSTFTLPCGQIKFIQEYELVGEKEIHLKFKMVFDQSVLPVAKVGVTLVLDSGLLNGKGEVKWLGRGPLENYVDRKNSQFFGFYDKKLSEMNYCYIRPQESGNRGDVSLVMMEGGGLDLGIHNLSSEGLNFSIREYSDKEIDKANHPYQLKKDGNLYLHLDAAHHGIGGDDSWTRRVHDEFILDKKTEYELDMVLHIDYS